MSSGYSYFDTELARIAARDQCEQVAERLLSSVAAIRARESQAALPASLLHERPSSDADRATYLAWSGAATVQAAEFEARAAAHDQKRNAEGIVEQFRALATSGPIAVPRRMSDEAGRSVSARSGRHEAQLVSTTGDAPSHQELIERVAVVLDGVDPAATEDEREELTVLARQVVDAPEESRRTLLTELRVRVQQVDRAVSERRKQLARAQFLVGTLKGLDDPAVADERVFLKVVARGGAVLTPADVERIERAREEAVAEQERRFVADRLARVLSGLGYHVDDGFLANLHAGRAGFALLDHSEEHAVRVEIAEGALDYGLVRTVQGEDAERDRELEGALCGHMGRFMATVQPDGVAFRFREHREPGSRPLEVSRAAAEVASRPKGSTKPALRERDR